MALICRSVAAGIPLSEALRSVSHEASEPSREEFVRVVNEVAIGQSLEAALWKLYDRIGLPSTPSLPSPSVCRPRQVAAWSRR